MMEEKYAPHAIEKKWQKYWEENSDRIVYHGKSFTGLQPFHICDGLFGSNSFLYGFLRSVQDQEIVY